MLSAYAVHKFQRGASAPLALRKLHLLILYLRVTDRAHIVNKYQDVFGLIGTELTFTPQRLGVNPGASSPSSFVVLHLANFFLEGQH